MNLPQEDKNLRSFLSADDIKPLAIQSTENIAEDLAALGNWIKVNKMRLAKDKSFVLQFRRNTPTFLLNNKLFIPSENVKDLGVLTSPDLNFKTHKREK